MGNSTTARNVSLSPREARPGRTDGAERDNVDDVNVPPPPKPKSAMDQALDILKGQLADAKAVRQENKTTVEGLDPSLAALQSLGGASALAEGKATGSYTNALAGAPTIDFGNYVGDYTSQGATAHADPGSIAAQRDALAQWRQQTNPQRTPQEEFLEAISRQKEEQTLAQQRAGIAQNMRAQGTAGSGQELAMNLAAQQQAGTNRMLEDMATNAGAVQRASDARTSYGNLATTMRNNSFDEASKRGTAADSAHEFNSKSRQTYQINKFQARQSERDKAVGRASDAYTAQTGAIKDTFDRGLTTGWNAPAQQAGLKVGVNTQGLNSQTTAGKDIAGNIVAQDAQHDATKKPGFNLVDPSTWF